VILRL